MNETSDTVTSYTAVLIALMVSNVDSFLTWGGVVLLVCRLIADVPRAFNTITKAFGKWL